jgi:fibronectin type 3 domain-containing protein/predicted small lipoprotein YifL
VRRALLLAAAVLPLAACGKKGDPLPPLPRIPARTTELRVEQRNDVAEISFPFPSLRADGEPLRDLARIEIYRIVDPSPALTGSAPAPAAAGSSDRAPIAGERRRAAAGRARQRSILEAATRIAQVPSDLFDRATRGGEIVYRDGLGPFFSPGPPPRRLAYAVVSVRRGGERSEVSNLAVFSPVEPPAAPRGVLALAEPDRICVLWKPPENGPEAGGYDVYRRALDEPDFGRPLNAKPVAGTEYPDASAAYGRTYVYTVTATAKEHPDVEGPPAIQFGIDYRDVFPPPPVGRVDALPEENLVRVLWDPVSAPDLAGYELDRAADGAEETRLNPQPLAAAEYVDRDVAAGHTYVYTVRSVDRAGNRSAPSPPARARPLPASEDQPPRR